MKLFWKIFIAVFASFTVLVSSVSYVTARKHVSDMENHLLEGNSFIVSFVSQEIETGYLESRWPFDSLSKLAQRDGFLFWWVVRDDGTIHMADEASFMGTSAYGYFPQVASMTGDRNAFMDKSQNYGIFMAPLQMGQARWSLWYGFSLSDISRMRQETIFLYALIGASSLLLLGIALYVIVRRFTGPTLDLAAGAEAIGKGDLTHRVKIETRDELGQLADSFNRMADDLQKTTVSKDYVDNIIGTMLDVLIVTDLNAEIRTVNRATGQLSGYGEKELVGKSVGTILAVPDETPLGGTRFGQLAEQGELTDYEMDLKTKDGTRIPILLSRTLMKGNGGNTDNVLYVARDITERKRAEEELQESRKRYLDMVNLLPQTIFELDEGGNLTFANRHGTLGFGYTLEDVQKGLNALELFVPEDRDRVIKDIQRVLGGKQESGANEYTALRKDGSTFPIIAYSAPVIRENKPVGLRGMLVDITERKQMEDALKASRRTFMDLVNFLPQSIWEIDETGNMTFANLHASLAYGYTLEDVREGLNALVMFIPEDRERVSQNIQRIMSGEELGGVEYTALRKDGSTFPVIAYSTPIIHEGRPVGLRGVTMDITERKQAEQKLRESEEKLQRIFQSVTDGITVTDLNGAITDANEAALQLGGVGSKSDLLGRSAFETIASRDQERALANMRELVERGTVGRAEHTLVKSDGSEYPAEISANILNDATGNPAGFVSVIRDITERKRMEQELTEKARQLEDASQAKSEFLASMSHELRTPLNAIIGFSELMLDSVPGEINEGQTECLNDILNSGQHLLNLINDVLDLAKVEAGKMELKLEEVSLADAVSDAVQTVQPMLQDKQHRLEVSVEEGLPQVRADRRRLRQVLLNLLSNAIKYTRPGGELGIDAITEGEWCQVSVTDNGIGIAEEAQRKLFEVFTRSHTLSGNEEAGTGLGLVLTRRFIETMRGKIWVESEYGKGSKFTFTLPLARKGKPFREEKEDEPVQALPKTQEAPLEPEQKTVLVVDDDHRARRLLMMWLREEGYAIIEASNGDEGIRKAKDLLPSVIVLDILMPDKDGWQVLEELKSAPETKDIPVVITSVMDEKELAFSLGAADYFVKPIDKDRFLKRLGELGLTQGKEVLVADDNPADVRLVASMLEAEGIGVMKAYGGEEAVTMAKGKKPALIVLDIMMPDLNGFEVIERLRADEETRDIPIIVLTMKDLTEHERETLNRQVLAIMEKTTFGREDFVSEVKRAESLSKI